MGRSPSYSFGSFCGSSCISLSRPKTLALASSTRSLRTSSASSCEYPWSRTADFSDARGPFARIMRGLRRSAMTAMTAFPLLVSLVGFYAALASAVTVTFDVVNSTNDTIFPRTVGAGSGDPTMDFAAVPPKGSARLSFERDSRFALFFAPDCSQDELGRLIECSSGNCPNEGCTSADKPVATMVYYDDGIVTASGPFGYNFALRAEFLSAECPPVSCSITIKARDKAPYCQGGAATSCFDGAILMVTVS